MSQNSLKIKNKIILKKPPVRVRSKKMHKIAKAMFPLSKASLVSVLDEFSVSIGWVSISVSIDWELKKEKLILLKVYL